MTSLKRKLLLFFGFIFLLISSDFTYALSKKEMYDKAVKVAKCVVQDYSCNFVISGIDPRDPLQDGAWLLKYLLASGAVNYDAGKAPPAGPGLETLADCNGEGKKAKIRLFDPYYTRAHWMQVVVLLHEVGHAAGLRHPTFEDSEEWNLRIGENCTTYELMKRCEDGNFEDFPWM